MFGGDSLQSMNSTTIKKSRMRRKLARPRNRNAYQSGRSATPILKFKRRTILIGIFLLLIMESIGAILSSPRFNIHTIKVAGTTTCTSTEINSVRNSTKLLFNQNILRAPLMSVKHSLTSLPWVQSVSVGRYALNGVYVHISARMPVAILKVDDISWEISSGAIIIRSARKRDSIYPVITSVVGGIRPGIQDPDPGVLTAIRLLTMIPISCPSNISTIKVDTLDNLTLIMHDGAVFKLGQPDDLQTKVDLINRIYSSTPNPAGKMLLIDLSCPSAPACILRQPLTKSPSSQASTSIP